MRSRTKFRTGLIQETGFMIKPGLRESVPKKKKKKSINPVSSQPRKENYKRQQVEEMLVVSNLIQHLPQELQFYLLLWI